MLGLDPEGGRITWQMFFGRVCPTLELAGTAAACAPLVTLTQLPNDPATLLPATVAASSSAPARDVLLFLLLLSLSRRRPRRPGVARPRELGTSRNPGFGAPAAAPSAQRQSSPPRVASCTWTGAAQQQRGKARLAVLGASLKEGPRSGLREAPLRPAAATWSKAAT